MHFWVWFVVLKGWLNLFKLGLWFVDLQQLGKIISVLHRKNTLDYVELEPVKQDHCCPDLYLNFRYIILTLLSDRGYSYVTAVASHWLDPVWRARDFCLWSAVPHFDHMIISTTLQGRFTLDLSHIMPRCSKTIAHCRRSYMFCWPVLQPPGVCLFGTEYCTKPKIVLDNFETSP